MNILQSQHVRVIERLHGCDFSPKLLRCPRAHVILVHDLDCHGLPGAHVNTKLHSGNRREGSYTFIHDKCVRLSLKIYSAQMLVRGPMVSHAGQNAGSNQYTTQNNGEILLMLSRLPVDTIIDKATPRESCSSNTWFQLPFWGCFENTRTRMVSVTRAAHRKSPRLWSPFHLLRPVGDTWEHLGPLLTKKKNR